MSSVTIVLAVLAILAAVIASGALARLLRSVVPLPLVQIAVGLAIGQLTGLRLRIDAEAFLLLFLPPLLFLDAWRIPKDAMRRDLRIVGELALGLVVATVLGLGLFLHWLIPAMPLALAFALAAVLSPTDAVAVGSIARRTPMPHRLRCVLEGEALLNDASALVCLRFAVAALLTGSFSIWSAVPSFLWVAAAGLALGAGLSWAVGVASARVAERFGEDAGAHILVTLLLPFGAYLLAEQVHASGILAAVAAGLVMTRVDRRARRPAATRMRRQATWDSVGFALNGAVFVLLGEQLSLIVHLGERSALASGAGDLPMLGAYIVAVALLLLAIRGAWVWVSMRVDIARRPAEHDFAAPPWPLVAAATLAGVRGTVTLVAVLTIPRAYADGTPLPTAAVAVTIATGVILVSLVIASLGLPPLLRRLRVDEAATDPREAVAERAAADVARLLAAAPAVLAARIRAERDVPADGEAASLRLALIEVERRSVVALHAEQRLDDPAAERLLAELDTAELFHRRGGRQGPSGAD